MTQFETRKTTGTTTYQIQVVKSYEGGIVGPYDVVARDLSHAQALFLVDVLNSKGWSAIQAYDTVQALVDSDSLHAELYNQMTRTGHLWQTPAQAA